MKGKHMAQGDQQSADPSTDELLQRIEELEQQQEQLNGQQQQIGNLFEQFKNGVISRRAFMGAVTAAAGAGALVGNASAHNASPSWGSSSGQIGSSSTPTDRAFVRDFHAESVITGSATIGGATALPVVDKGNIGNLSGTGASSETYGSTGFKTIFDFASAVDIHGGHIVGWAISDLRFTWDDDTTDTMPAGSHGGRGTDSSAASDGEHDVGYIPRVSGVKKLEFEIGSTSGEWGYSVLHT